jgi:hypothetical protein
VRSGSQSEIGGLGALNFRRLAGDLRGVDTKEASGCPSSGRDRTQRGAACVSAAARAEACRSAAVREAGQEPGDVVPAADRG